MLRLANRWTSRVHVPVYFDKESLLMCLDFFMIWRVTVPFSNYINIANEYAHLPITAWQILLIKTYLCTCCRQQSVVDWDLRRQVGAKSPKLCRAYVCVFRTGKQVSERDSCHHRTIPATTHTQRMWTPHLPYLLDDYSTRRWHWSQHLTSIRYMRS